MFYRYLSLSTLADISKKNILFLKIYLIRALFYAGALITNNITNMSHMFYECSSLSSFQEFSKRNTNNNIISIIIMVKYAKKNDVL